MAFDAVLSSATSAALKNMMYPWAILIIIPIFFAIAFLLSRSFVRIQMEPEIARRKRFLRKFMLITRTAIFLLILIAIATPFVQKEVTEEGDPYLKIIIDNSTSFTMFDQAPVNNLVKELQKRMRVEVKYAGDSKSSPLGDAVLSNLQNNANILLISDGQNNQGVDLGDVALYATRLNASLSTVRMDPKNNDVSVAISGPGKTLEEVQNRYTVKLKKTGDPGTTHVVIKVDGQVVMDKTTNEEEVLFNTSFTGGYHRITAQAMDPKDDQFPENNIFYKTVKVVKKPKVYYFTKKASPLETLLRQVYEVQSGPSIPADLSQFHAMVINDPNVKGLTEHDIEVINDFTSEGNGMLAVGGDNSFEKGGYKDSRYEQLLPVFVSEPGKKEGDNNIVIVVDISGSTGTKMAGPGNEVIVVDVEKAQAIALYNTMKAENKVGIVAFNNQAFLIEPMSYIYEKVGVIDKLSRLTHSGGTLISGGLIEAMELLKPLQGSKNIIIISDGQTQLSESAFAAAKLADQMGIKVYTVGVGPQTNEFIMMKIAGLTNGIYFRVDQSSKLKILFGPPDQGEKTKFGLSILNENHFITEDAPPIMGTISGYNIVVPKTTAQMLVTTDVGDPVLTVWRYGLGKVAAYTTDDGEKYSGSMLSGENSYIMLRAMNWLIGDPDRKSDQYINVDDTRLGDSAKITVKSPTPPAAPGVAFYKQEDDIYTATIMPTQTGFQEVAGAIFAVNYQTEFDSLGVEEKFYDLVRTTGGKVFEQGDAEQIAQEVRTRSKRMIDKKTPIRSPFLIAAIILFIFEIAVRQVVKNRRKEEPEGRGRSAS